VSIEIKGVEQSVLRACLLTHHLDTPRRCPILMTSGYDKSSEQFFNTIGQEQPVSVATQISPKPTFASTISKC
jgi:hypothetical protein